MNKSTKPTEPAVNQDGVSPSGPPSGYVPRARVRRAIRAAEQRQLSRKHNQMAFAAFILERECFPIRDGSEDPDFILLLDAAQKVRLRYRSRAFALEYYITKVLGESSAEMEKFVKDAMDAIRRHESADGT